MILFGLTLYNYKPTVQIYFSLYSALPSMNRLNEGNPFSASFLNNLIPSTAFSLRWIKPSGILPEKSSGSIR